MAKTKSLKTKPFKANPPQSPTAFSQRKRSKSTLRPVSRLRPLRSTRPPPDSPADPLPVTVDPPPAGTEARPYPVPTEPLPPAAGLQEIVLSARPKKSLAGLGSLFQDAGFSRMQYNSRELVFERQSPVDKSRFDYRIVLGRQSIRLLYPVDLMQNARRRFIEVMPVFLHTLTLLESYYDLEPTPLFQSFLSFTRDLSRHFGKDAAELASELDEWKTKYTDVQKKYGELVRASEENARILLECERRRDELHKRVDQLEGMSNEALKQALFEWIKVHGGSLEISEFAKSHSLPTTRIEEGLRMLTQEGYIKRRSEG